MGPEIPLFRVHRSLPETAPSLLPACDGERGIARRLARIARHLVAIEEDRKRLIEWYACERLESRAYIEANRELDAKLARLKREKREIAAGALPLHAETVLETGLRTFCEDAKATFNASVDPEARRAFLAGRIERVIYRKYQVIIVGAVPLPPIDGDGVRKAAFRIAAEIDIEAVKSRPRPTKPGDGGTRSMQALHRLYRQPGAPHLVIGDRCGGGTNAMKEVVA